MGGGRNQRRQPYQSLNEGPRSRKNKNPYSDDETEDPEYPNQQNFRPDSGLGNFDDVIKGSRLRDQGRKLKNFFSLSLTTPTLAARF